MTEVSVLRRGRMAAGPCLRAGVRAGQVHSTRQTTTSTTSFPTRSHSSPAHRRLSPQGDQHRSPLSIYSTCPLTLNSSADPRRDRSQPPAASSPCRRLPLLPSSRRLPRPQRLSQKPHPLARIREPSSRRSFSRISRHCSPSSRPSPKTCTRSSRTGPLSSPPTHVCTNFFPVSSSSRARSMA